MSTQDSPRPDEEPWVPPLWPRYVGVVVLSLMVAGCVAMIVFGVTGGGSDFFAAILGGVGLWYVGNELRSALARLRVARDGGTANGPAAR